MKPCRRCGCGDIEVSVLDFPFACLFG